MKGVAVKQQLEPVRTWHQGINICINPGPEPPPRQVANNILPTATQAATRNFTHYFILPNSPRQKVGFLSKQKKSLWLEEMQPSQKDVMPIKKKRKCERMMRFVCLDRGPSQSQSVVVYQKLRHLRVFRPFVYWQFNGSPQRLPVAG
jgi:hypothetical protein